MQMNNVSAFSMNDKVLMCIVNKKYIVDFELV